MRPNKDSRGTTPARGQVVSSFLFPKNCGNGEKNKAVETNREYAFSWDEKQDAVLRKGETEVGGDF